jgi:ABC-type proline/glycine betaine transport system permease subunit
MAKIVLSETQASGGVKDHNVRYVLAGSVAFVVLALIIIFAVR